MSSNTDQVQVFHQDRSWHNDHSASYILPNDQDETDRLFVQHNILRKFFDGNFRVPIDRKLETGITVLDSGCGPGVWTVDMAREYPNSKFYGIDISNVVPDTWKLKNTTFTTGNITKNLHYNDEFFDYIHQRLLLLGLTRKDWKNTLQSFYQALKPGGYIELMEVNSHYFENTGPLVNEMTDTFLEMMDDRKMVPHLDVELEQFVKDAGFINVQVIRRDLPMNNDEDEGRMLWENFYRVFDGLGTFLIQYNKKWADLNAFKAHIAKCQVETAETKSTYKYFIVHAQKPL
ncbi:S-adenosyl-L-methionine-dependent methyltransferase [Backusella circina FSU 941]|nr:S-adenosyl-L-methionine-dependent methyltransferase [Backusella circina FSU 941]